MLTLSSLHLGGAGGAPVPELSVSLPSGVLRRDDDFSMEQYWRRPVSNVDVFGIEYRSRQRAVLEFGCAPGIQLHLRLCGSGNYMIDDDDRILGNACELQFFSSHNAWKKTVMEPENGFNRTVVLAASADNMRYFLGPMADRYLAGKGLDVSHIRIPMDSALKQAAEEMLSFDAAISIHALLRESRIYEVMAYSFDSLLKVDPNAADHSSIRARDAMRIREATEILLAELLAPPTIPELAVRVGVNSSKLKAAFKQLNGCTIGTFVRDARLNRAAHLLRNDANVQLVAYEVGYSHAGNFARLFRERFGMNPNCYRRLHNGGLRHLDARDEGTSAGPDDRRSA